MFSPQEYIDDQSSVISELKQTLEDRDREHERVVKELKESSAKEIEKIRQKMKQDNLIIIKAGSDRIAIKDKDITRLKQDLQDLKNQL